MNATERMQALISKHARPGPVSAEQRDRMGTRMADSRDAVEQLIEVYRRKHVVTDPDARFNALGAVVLIAKSVAPSADHLAMLLAAAVELLAEHAKEVDGG
jgi:hypothetical protein